MGKRHAARKPPIVIFSFMVEAFQGKIVALVSIMTDLNLNILPYHGVGVGLDATNANQKGGFFYQSDLLYVLITPLDPLLQQRGFSCCRQECLSSSLIGSCQIYFVSPQLYLLWYIGTS